MKPRLMKVASLSQPLLGYAALVIACAVLARAQSDGPAHLALRNPGSTHSLALTQTRYQLRAAEPAKISAPRETLDFLVKAKNRNIEIVGQETKGFVVGPSIRGDEVLLAASLTMKPGAYAVTVSATSEKGEERETTLDVVLDPVQTVPLNATKPPVVLLNGWQFVCSTSSSSADTFGNLAQYLQDDGVPVVYFFDNCVEGPNSKIEDLGTTLGTVLGLIHYDNGAPVPQIDLVTHSMGGLIARAYLAGLHSDESVMPPSNPKVRKLVLIATPNFGSFFAASFSLFTGTQSAEMIPGSSFLWNLATWNQRVDDLRGVDALAVIGNAGPWNGNPNYSDGVVSLTSASIGFARDSSRTRILPYCHIDSASFAGQFIDCSGKGIAHVDEAPETGQIVRSFLADTSTWMSVGLSGTPSQDPILSKWGGIYFAQETATAQWVMDLTQVSFGTVVLQEGYASGENFYSEFVSGTGEIQADSQSLGMLTCGPVTVRVGLVSTIRCKVPPVIGSVGPLSPSTSGSIVQSGRTITINGSGFGQQQCSSCAVWAYPGPTSLRVLTWSDQSITVMLPSSSGFVQLVVLTASGSDEINIMTTALSLAGSMAQLASGGGWDTTLTLVNTGAAPGEALLNFFANDGGPLLLPLTLPQKSSSGSQVATTLDQTLNANSMLVIDSQQPSNPTAQVGSAQLLTTDTISGFAIFKYAPTGQEAVVPLETRNAPSYVLAFDNTGVLGTGVAITNVATQPANIPVIIRDDTGDQIATDTVSLTAQGHTSFMLTNNYAITAGKRGTVEFDTPTPGQMSVAAKMYAILAGRRAPVL